MRNRLAMLNMAQPLTEVHIGFEVLSVCGPEPSRKHLADRNPDQLRLSGSLSTTKQYLVNTNSDKIACICCWQRFRPYAALLVSGFFFSPISQAILITRQPQMSKMVRADRSMKKDPTTATRCGHYAWQCLSMSEVNCASSPQ